MSIVAFLCQPYHRGGVTRWMVDAAEEFAKRGTTVYFISVEPKEEFISGKNRPLVRTLFSDLNKINLITTEVGYNFELGTSEYRANVYVKSIITKLPSGTPIIVSDDPSVWMAAAGVSNNYPMIGVLHGDDLPYFELAMTYYKNVSLFIAVSKRIATKCKSYPVLNNIEIPVIPCGIPLTPYKNFRTKNEEQLNLIWAGRIEEKSKRVSDLIAISLHLKKLSINFHLDIIGHGCDSDWMVSKIEESKLSNYITMHGWMNSENILQKMSSADILLLPSNYEGMPITVMEALSCGCGVVASRVSGVEDIEDSSLGKTCLWLYSIGNILEATNAIIAASKNLGDELSTNSRKLAEQEYSIETCVTKYSNNISSIANSGKEKFKIAHSKILFSFFLAFARKSKLRVSNS